MSKLLIFFCFVTTFTSYFILARNHQKVVIEQGLLSGIKLRTRGGRDVFGFLGVPYAAPPTGHLRFKVHE